MSRVATTPEADQDLVEIARYTATAQGSIEAARAFVWMLKDKFLLLAANPDLGRCETRSPACAWCVRIRCAAFR